jgi:hypothetical protein
LLEKKKLYLKNSLWGLFGKHLKRPFIFVLI